MEGPIFLEVDYHHRFHFTFGKHLVHICGELKRMQMGKKINKGRVVCRKEWVLSFLLSNNLDH